MSEETGRDTGAGRLPASPITADQRESMPAAGRTLAADSTKPAAATKKKSDTTPHLPVVLQDLASLERERQRLAAELRSLQEAKIATEQRLKAAEEARQQRLEKLGKYDRFFMSDKGSHPLGRRYAVQQTAVAIQKLLASADNQRTKVLNKLNHAVDANNEIKRRIDLLRRESCVFRELFAKMQVY